MGSRSVDCSSRSSYPASSFQALSTLTTMSSLTRFSCSISRRTRRSSTGRRQRIRSQFGILNGAPRLHRCTVDFSSDALQKVSWFLLPTSKKVFTVFALTHAVPTGVKVEGSPWPTRTSPASCRNSSMRKLLQYTSCISPVSLLALNVEPLVVVIAACSSRRALELIRAERSSRTRAHMPESSRTRATPS